MGTIISRDWYILSLADCCCKTWPKSIIVNIPAGILLVDLKQNNNPAILLWSLWELKRPMIQSPCARDQAFNYRLQQHRLIRALNNAALSILTCQNSLLSVLLLAEIFTFRINRSETISEWPGAISHSGLYWSSLLMTYMFLVQTLAYVVQDRPVSSKHTSHREAILSILNCLLINIYLSDRAGRLEL